MNNTEKNIGIELLRSISMILIVMLHLLNCGGILDVADKATYYGKIAWTLNIIAYCSVNCYALISGYVGYKSTPKFSRILTVWLTTFFYSVLITLIIFIINPGLVSPRYWLQAFLPITSGQYWYVTAYIGLMFFAPFLNRGIRELSKKVLGIMILLAIILAMVIPSFVLDVDSFGLLSGYSTIWLCILYVVGGYLSRFEIAGLFRKWQLIVIFAISGFITFICDRRQIFHLVNYASPTIFICAVAVLLFCVNIPFKSDSMLSKIIIWLGAGSLSVFLIHVHPLVFGPYLGGSATWLINYSLPVFTILTILCALAIWLICIILDIPRRYLFKGLQIPKRLEVIDKWLKPTE